MSEIKIYSWNVNGIRAAERKGFVDWVLETKPDILCVQETKAQTDQLSDKLTNIPGYEFYHNAAQRKGYSGTLTYSKVPVKEHSFSLEVPEFDSEGRVVITKYDKFTLINLYFPNGKKDEERLDYKMRFYDRFLEFILELRNNGEKVIFCGDVNTAHKEIDLTHPKPNSKHSGFLPKEREWIDKVIDNGFVDAFREFDTSPEKYTWWSVRGGARAKNVGWRIDYFFVDKALLPYVKNCSIHPEVMGSDHCPISLVLDI